MNIKEYIAKIKEELLKLKDTEDEKVKEVYNNVNDILGKVIDQNDADAEKTKVEDAKLPKEKVEETKVEDKPEAEDESKDKEKVEATKEDEKETKPEETKPVKSEKVEPVVDKKVDAELKKEEVSLSADVADSLKQAALELQSKDNELATKDEVISTYKLQIAELSAELDKYKQVELLELAKEEDKKIVKLIELYKGLGITKNSEDLKQKFNTEQIENLIFDLSAMSPKTQTRVIRKTVVNAELELGSSTHKKNDTISDAETASLLFGI